MRKIVDLYASSLKEFKNVRSLTLMAMFLAISVVLGTLTIMIGDFLKINFTFLPNNFAYYLFGPVVGAIFGTAADIITFLFKPFGAYFPGFTISGILSGLLYGTMLYKRPMKLWRLIVANLFHMVIINILLNTYWLQLLTGVPYMTNLPVRAIKALIMFPVETLLVFGVIKGVEASGILKSFREQRTIGGGIQSSGNDHLKK